MNEVGSILNTQCIMSIILILCYLDNNSFRTAEVNLLNKQSVAAEANTTLYKATIVKFPSHSILP